MLSNETFLEYVKSVIMAVILALILIIFVIQAFFIHSGSMWPTLEVRDRILVNKFIYQFKDPEKNDIIVFKYPLEPRRKFIKRVIGLSGDRMQIINGQVYVNDEPLKENYLLTRGYSNYGPIVVPEDNYFVLGDNRNNSEDSRFWGFVPNENIIGQAILVFWPLNRVKLLKDR
ncbi:MAG: signal peptidase I [Halanaerobiales bacterium]|nr:signal peptidase I [Halanaerobiales bacterium]